MASAHPHPRGSCSTSAPPRSRVARAPLRCLLRHFPPPQPGSSAPFLHREGRLVTERVLRELTVSKAVEHLQLLIHALPLPLTEIRASLPALDVLRMRHCCSSVLFCLGFPVRFSHRCWVCFVSLRRTALFSRKHRAATQPC